MTADVPTSAFGGLALGLFGSLHCLGMCGGIAGALGQAVPATSSAMKTLGPGLYSLGRVTSYALAGTIAGAFGEAFAAATGVGVSLRVVAAVLVLAMALHVGGWWNGIVRIERAGLGVWRRLAPLTTRVGPPDRPWKIAALGMLWGWLPCGLVYSALAVAASTGSAGSGAFFMSCFGLGTVPAMWLAAGAASTLRRRLAHREMRRAAGALLIVLALWTLNGAMMPLQARGSPGHGLPEAGAECGPSEAAEPSVRR